LTKEILIEPVFGQMRVVEGFNRFLLRGIDNVGTEWKTGVIAHNILKIARRVLEGKIQLLKVACV
jgi:hypothetical protein